MMLGARDRRRRLLLVPLLAVAALAAFAITNALAVHDEGVFQLDGNAFSTANSTPTMPSAAEDADNLCAKHVKVENTNPADEFCHPASAALTTYLSGLTTTATRSAFVTDASGLFASGANDDQWTSGSKDDQETSEWKYKQAASSNDKSDIENAFAAVYTASNNHKIIYFGGDRISNSGSENTAFWFMQKSVVEKPNLASGCTINSGCPFTGEHTAANPGADNCLTPQGQTTGLNMSTTAPGPLPMRAETSSS
jgi:hypothetical protein